MLVHLWLCWCSCLRGCSCLNCTNQVNHTFCLVDALLAMLVHLRQVHPLIGHFLQGCSCLRGCSCLNCTNQVNHTFCLVGALLVMSVHLRQVHPLIGHFLLCWCTSFYVGALETSAPPIVTNPYTDVRAAASCSSGGSPSLPRR